MAKKKLNKKVAVAGSIFLALFALLVILFILYKLRGPQAFIDDGDAAVAAKDYEGAIKDYARALARAKDNDTRKKILFKLADTHILNNDWRKTLACWNKVATTDTADVNSRTKMLDFFYDVADSGQYSVWKTVRDTVDELLAIPDISPQAKWYLIKGRAQLELAKGGEVVDRVKALDDAFTVLTQAQKLDPKNPDVYRYLAEDISEKGNVLASKGMLAEQTTAQDNARKLLDKAISVAPDDPNAYIQLLTMKLFTALNLDDKKQISALEPDYIGLAKKYPQNPDVFTALSVYYRRDPNDIDKALQASEKAMELAPQSAKYAINAADAYYRKGSLAKDDKYTKKAIEIAKHALTLPDAQDTTSSRQYANKMNKLSLNMFLANRYTEEILALRADAPKQQRDNLITEDANAVHEISQILGSGEDPYVLSAEGMLAYARGNTAEGIKKMYTAYEQRKQSDTRNQDVQLGQLSYMLAGAFINSSEIGATQDFLSTALQRRIYLTKPDTLLLYARVLLQLRQYNDVIRIVNAYETFFKPNTVSQLLRARATIGAGQLDDAQALLAKMNAGDPNTAAAEMFLLQTKIEQASTARMDANETKTETAPIQAEIDKYRAEQVKFAQKVLQSEPNASDALVIICEYYMAKNDVQKAKTAVDSVLSRSPNNTMANVYKVLLAQPDPGKLTPQQRLDLSEQAYAAIPAPITRSLSLAEYYKAREKFDKAIAEYKKVLEIEPANKEAVVGIFDTALQAKDLALAEQFASIAQKENLDLCGGQVFMARLAMAKKDYKDALSRLDIALKERPVFSLGHTLRSSVNAALGNEQLAIEDARQAIGTNPLDGMAAKNLANLLYQRNFKLGQKVTTEQKAEAQAAIERAYALNPREWQLLSFYAEYISDVDPVRALAIRQRLQTAVPNVQNATLLGNLAVKMASSEKDAARKQGYMDIAASAYEQGYKLEPNNVALLKGYADFYNLAGKPDLATKLLGAASNKNLLWMNYIQSGQFEKAAAILEGLYKENPKNVDVIKGLVLTSQSLNDTQGVTKYSQELLSLENTPDNQLGQIKAFLQVGLVEQAQKQLASFKEKYPDDNRIMILEAWLLTKKGQFTDAVAILNKDLEIRPDDSVAWHLKGQVNFARGNYEDAISDFKKAKASMPSTQIRTDLARAYIRAGRGDDAINELVSMAEAQPDNMSTYFMLEDVYRILKRTDALNRFYADLIKRFPDNPFWYNKAGTFTRGLAEEEDWKNRGDKAFSSPRWNDVFALSKTALDLSQKGNSDLSKEQLHQQMLLALDNYLTAMLKKKQYDQLIAYASQYVDSDLAVVAFIQMADAKAELGDKVTAFDYYNKGLMKAASEEGVVFNILRKMTVTVGRDETIKWCTEQLKTTPDSLPINLAMCYLMRMNSENVKALTYVDKCLQIAGSKSPAYRSLVDTKQSILLDVYNSTSDKKYFNDAVKLYEDYIASSPSVEVGALNNLAYLLANNDTDIDKAVSYAKKACDVVQNNPNILDTYAYVLYKKGDYAKASEIAQQALQLSEKTSVSAPADVYEHVGMINAKLGRKNEAVNAYQNALKVGEKTLSDAAKQRIQSAIEALK